jgi:ABC-type transporter MlaC component
VAVKDVQRFVKEFTEFVKTRYPEVLKELTEKADLGKPASAGSPASPGKEAVPPTPASAVRQGIDKALKAFRDGFQAS